MEKLFKRCAAIKEIDRSLRNLCSVSSGTRFTSRNQIATLVHNGKKILPLLIFQRCNPTRSFLCGQPTAVGNQDLTLNVEVPNLIAMEATPTVGSQRPPPDGSSLPLILVVDDNTFSRHVIVQYLRDAGFQVMEASSGPQAIQLLTTVPGIRLMTLDVEMPSMDGFLVLEEIASPARTVAIRAAGNEQVPVILVTANDTLANRRRAFELGAADFVKKDQVADQLALTARLILTPATAFAHMSVLVVDDSPTARHVIVSCIRQLGAEGLAAGDGAEALEILRQRPGAIDLVVTDMHMPRMNGDELCRRIRQELGLKDLPVILLSGTSEPETKIRLFREGATDYLEKPFIKEELIARLNVHLKRQQLDRNLRANLARMKELDKLKDEFLAVCSHDLRSPLAGILGVTEILLRDTRLDPDQQEKLRQILGSGHYLLELINDILDLGRAQAQKTNMEFEALEPLAIVRQCLGNFRPLADAKHLTLSLTEDAGLSSATMSGNRISLSRIFTNLISNAVKFTPDGGHIFLRAESVDNGHHLVIACQDTGIGIPESMMSKLFSRYSKVSREGTRGEHGTGLGLIITRELIEAHGGQLTVGSTVGDGTTFTITLPLIPSVAPVALTASEASAPPVTFRKLHILAAEDNTVNMMVLTHLLAKAGHDAHPVTNGRQAVNAFMKQEQSNLFEAILLDIEMPEMDGREAALAIREHERTTARKPTPLIALTAHVGENERKELLQHGFDAVLTKPINAVEINAVLQRLSGR